MICISMSVPQKDQSLYTWSVLFSVFRKCLLCTPLHSSIEVRWSDFGRSIDVVFEGTVPVYSRTIETASGLPLPVNPYKWIGNLQLKPLIHLLPLYFLLKDNWQTKIFSIPNHRVTRSNITFTFHIASFFFSLNNRFTQ